MRLPRTSLALCTVLVLGLASAQSADQLFTQGVNAYKAGDTAGAAAAFKAALATNPGHEEAFRMLDRVEQRVLMDMLTERGELGGLTDRLLAIAELGRREVIEDPGAAQEVVDRLLSGDESQRQAAILELRSRYGQWAVPALVGPLGNSASLDNRVSAIQALVRMGTPAVAPLMATLDAEDPLTRRNAAAVLGTIGDKRAAASLAWIAQTDPDEGAREAGREALSKMGLMTTDAATMSVTQAQRYLRGDDEMVRPYDASTIVWHWDGGGLVSERVLGGLQPLMLAEGDLIRALSHGGGSQVRATLAAIHAAQRAEIVAASTLPALEGHELLTAAQEMLPDLDLNLALAGRFRGQALMICLTTTPRRPLAAAQLMAHMGGSVEERQALRAALGDPDPLVSQGAALALAGLGDMDAQVAQRLGDALAGVPQRLVMSIGATGLVGGTTGWMVLSSQSVQEGMLRAKTFPPKDVIVLQDGLQGVTLDALVFGFTNDPRTADTPVIVVTSDVAGVQALYGGQVAKVVSSAGMADVQEVAGERRPEQQAVIDRALEASHALMAAPASLARHASPAIARGLQAGAEDDVRVALLHLVAHAGVVEALPDVEAMIGDEEASSEVRVATLKAAARLWAITGGQAGGDFSGALLAAIDGDDDDVATAAAAALGQLQGVPEAMLGDAVR